VGQNHGEEKNSAKYIYFSPSIKQSSMGWWTSIFCTSRSNILPGSYFVKDIQ